MAAKVKTQQPQSWINLAEIERLLALETRENSDIRKVTAVRWINRKESPKEARQYKSEWLIVWFFKSADQ